MSASRSAEAVTAILGARLVEPFELFTIRSWGRFARGRLILCGSENDGPLATVAIGEGGAIEVTHPARDRSQGRTGVDALEHLDLTRGIGVVSRLPIVWPANDGGLEASHSHANSPFLGDSFVG